MREKEEFETINKEITRLILKKTKLWLRCIWCIRTTILNAKQVIQHYWSYEKN
jgi:hypothetical protein